MQHAEKGQRDRKKPTAEWEQSVHNFLILMKKVGLLSLRFTLTAAAMLGLAASALAADKVKVGMLSTLSGPGAALGVDIRDGFNLAVKHGNGKFGGLPVEVARIAGVDLHLLAHGQVPGADLRPDGRQVREGIERGARPDPIGQLVEPGESVRDLVRAGAGVAPGQSMPAALKAAGYVPARPAGQRWVPRK